MFNYVPFKAMRVITYTRPNLSYSILAKEPRGIKYTFDMLQVGSSHQLLRRYMSGCLPTRAALSYTVRFRYLAVTFPHESRTTPIAHPWDQGKSFFREFEKWPKFYLESFCAVVNDVL